MEMMDRKFWYVSNHAKHPGDESYVSWSVFLMIITDKHLYLCRNQEEQALMSTWLLMYGKSIEMAPITPGTHVPPEYLRRRAIQTEMIYGWISTPPEEYPWH